MRWKKGDLEEGKKLPPKGLETHKSMSSFLGAEKRNLGDRVRRAVTFGEGVDGVRGVGGVGGGRRHEGAF